MNLRDRIGATLDRHAIREDSATCLCGERDLWTKQDKRDHLANDLESVLLAAIVDGWTEAAKGAR